MVETAIAVGSVPPDWFDDDRLTLTMLDVLHTRAESAKKRRR